MDCSYAVCHYGGSFEDSTYMGGNAMLIALPRSISMENLHCLLSESCQVPLPLKISTFLTMGGSTSLVDIPSIDAYIYVRDSPQNNDGLHLYLQHVAPITGQSSRNTIPSNYGHRESRKNRAGGFKTRDPSYGLRVEPEAIDYSRFTTLGDHNDGINYEIGSPPPEIDEEAAIADCMDGGISTLYVGKLYKDNVAFRNDVHHISVTDNFETKHVTNNKERVRFVCKEDGCQWFVYAKKVGDEGLFEIRKLNVEHTCIGRSGVYSHPSADENWVKNQIISRIKNDFKKVLTPRQLLLDLRTEFSVQLSYSKVWRAREKAMEELYGNDYDAYASLNDYADSLLDSNPGTCVFIRESIDSNFEKIFIFLNSTIQGFRNGCLPIVALDGCFIKNKFGGVILSATGFDPNFQMFPLAYSIVEKEDRPSWEWFLHCFRYSLEDSWDPQLPMKFSDIYFISDKQKGLISSITTVFPGHYHFFCVQHFKENAMKHFKNELVKNMIQAVASKTNKIECDEALHDILREHPALYQWIMTPSRGDPTHLADPTHELDRWTMAYSPVARYLVIHSNMAETFNSWITPLRQLPATRILEEIRIKLVDLHNRRRLIAEKWESEYPPKIEVRLQLRIKNSNQITAEQVNEDTYEVSDGRRGRTRRVVNLREWTCTCGMWYQSRIPCTHVVAACRIRRYDVKDYIYPELTVEAYKRAYGTPMEGLAEPYYSRPGGNYENPMLPPTFERRPGRPRVRRINTTERLGPPRELRCTVCGNVGHNRQTCREPARF